MDTIAGVTVFKTASSTNRTRSYIEIGSPAWTRTTTIRLTAGHAALTLLGRVVPPRGFAPRSSTYQADALLLSYGGWLEIGRAPRCCPGFLLVPSEAGLLTPSRAMFKLAACAGIAPATFRSTGGCSSWLS
jgi:hypothetical protein